MAETGPQHGENQRDGIRSAESPPLSKTSHESSTEDVEKSVVLPIEDSCRVDTDGTVPCSDPELPINWSKSRKWRNVLMVASLTFLTYVYPPSLLS